MLHFIWTIIIGFVAGLIARAVTPGDKGPQGFILTSILGIIGALAALLLTRLMENLLYKVSPCDPLAFASAFVIMTVVAIAACFLPAWRATRIDPAQALRDQ